MTRLVLICLLILNAGVADAEWAQFRGPNGSGVAPNADPPIEFGQEKNLLWRLRVKSGHSSPIVSGNSIFLTTYDDQSKRLAVLAVDRNHGTVRWEHEIDTDEIERGHPSFNPASSTPVTDGEYVIAYFGSFGMICLNFEGEEQWRFRLPLAKSFAGNAISPVIFGDRVILYRGNYVDHFLLAVDKTSGKELWRTPQSEPFHPELACTAIPIVHEKQLILHGARSVQGFDLETGKQRWITKCATTATSAPLVVGDRVLVAAWNKMGEPSLRPDFPTFEHLVRAHDTNGNGLIERSEFPRLWIFHRPEGAEAPQNGAPLGFKRVDHDKDGVIDKQEWNRQLKDLERFRQGYENHGLLSLPLDQSGVLPIDAVLTLETQGIPEVPSPISDGRYLYLVKNGGQVTCIDLATRKRVYRKRTGGRGTHYASPIIAGDHLYLSDGSGRVSVMRVGESGEVVAVTEMGEGVYATPAAVGDCLFVRTHATLYAFKQR